MGRRLAPKSGEEHAAAEGKLVEREEPLPSREGLEPLLVLALARKKQPS